MIRALSRSILQTRADLADALERMDPPGRINEVIDACIYTGGSLIPARTGKGGAHYAEIELLGIYHAGNDEAEAIANWIKAVRRMQEPATGNDPDATPHRDARIAGAAQ